MDSISIDIKKIFRVFSCFSWFKNVFMYFISLVFVFFSFMNMTSAKTIKVAAVNSWSEPLAINSNIKCIEEYLQKLVVEGADYALFPELCVSGYINNNDDLAKFVNIKDSVLKELSKLSLANDIVFSVGLPMLYGDGYGIAQLTYSKGEVINTHFKTHISVHEKQVYVAGNKLTTFNSNRFNIGMQLCLESHYPELSILYQKEGANLLCFAFASPRETPENKLQRFKMMLQARAYDNACFVMACNQTGKTPSGKDYAGAAVIISPRGKILAQSIGMKPSYCTAELDFADIERIQNSKMSNFPAYRNENVE